jgi:cellulose synthase/poly-beta-1,6-N-acetylglucosamine synthase-like glycosyltransferase
LYSEAEPGSMIAKITFWVCLALIGYAYVGYPLLIVLISFFVNNKVKTAPIEPKVSLLITAYNEEKHIETKLKNCLELNYPKDRLEIVVASDGSTDSTDDIVKSYEKNIAGIKVVLHRVEGRLGKTATQNSALKACKGEIIVFSDAACMYDPGAIRALVRNYADPTVGAVSGMYNYTNIKGSSVGFATILFWNLENFIKSKQTKIKTITGCCGCIYSIRKAFYTPLPPDIISDLVEPLTILQKGYRIVFEPAALALEETAGKTEEEFKMRIRVIVRGMNGMLFVRKLYNPFKYPFVSMQLISHKLMRWLVPVFCIVAFLSNLVLAGTSPVYAALLLVQLLFYFLAGLGYALDKRGVHKKIFYLPLYFCTLNLASLISMFKVLRRENIVTWQTQR